MMQKQFERRQTGFTFIELLVFITITGMVATAIILSGVTALRKTPATQNQWVALEAASSCMEWFLNQRRINGYTALTCPSTPATTACAAPSGFTVTANVTCTTWNSDANYKTITVSVTGLSSTSLSVQIGNY
jgi:Tfp pilus assembly protein PilE